MEKVVFKPWQFGYRINLPIQKVLVPLVHRGSKKVSKLWLLWLGNVLANLFHKSWNGQFVILLGSWETALMWSLLCSPSPVQTQHKPLIVQFSANWKLKLLSKCWMSTAKPFGNQSGSWHQFKKQNRCLRISDVFARVVLLSSNQLYHCFLVCGCGAPTSESLGVLVKCRLLGLNPDLLNQNLKGRFILVQNNFEIHAWFFIICIFYGLFEVASVLLM